MIGPVKRAIANLPIRINSSAQWRLQGQGSWRCLLDVTNQGLFKSATLAISLLYTNQLCDWWCFDHKFIIIVVKFPE